MPKNKVRPLCVGALGVLCCSAIVMWPIQSERELDLRPQTTIAEDEEPGMLADLDLSPDGRRFATLKRLPSEDYCPVVFRLCDTHTGTAIRLATMAVERRCFSPQEIRPPWFSPDGSLVSIVIRSKAGGGEIVFYAAEDGAIVHRIPLGGQGYVGVVSLAHASAQRVAVERQSGFLQGRKKILLWDLETESIVREFYAKPGTSRLVLSPDGKRYLTSRIDRRDGGDYAGELRCAETGELIAELPGHESPPIVFAFSPDGSKLVTAGPDGIAAMWDAAYGDRIASLAPYPGKDAHVTAAVFSLEGDRLLTGYSRKAVVLPVECTQRWLHLLWQDLIPSVLIGRALAETTAKLWDVKTGELLRSFGWHRGVRAAGFHSGGRQIVTLDRRGAVRWWNTADLRH